MTKIPLGLITMLAWSSKLRQDPSHILGRLIFNSSSLRQINSHWGDESQLLP